MGVGAAIVLVVLALVASVLITALSPVGSTTVFDSRAGAAGTESPTRSSVPPASPGGGEGIESHATVLVHLLGAVAHPGVYELAEGARVVDAVGRAGGFTPEADQASVNLARLLTDGEQVRVLAVGEAPTGAAAAGGGGGATTGAGMGGGASGALVNLNSATELDLDALPRIGPAMAARIVAWRTDNGPFTAVDDLLEVAGIGEKTLEGLRPLVTI
ncbi:MAG: ComEA family DNA-binding protein [Myxococcaceae bacterium]|nr:MAG: ComEA family DNA-binding protein [Myxococcaceae bacterium]